MSIKYIASNWRLLNKAGVDSYKSDNYGLTYDGSNEVIQADDFQLTNSVDTCSYSAWVNIDSSATGVRGIFGKGSSSAFEFNVRYYTAGTNLFIIQINGTTVFKNSSLSLATDTWHHIVVVIDRNLSAGSNIKLFVNNAEITNESSVTFSQFTSTGYPLYIGAEANTAFSSRFKWLGKISEAAVFDYALSATQISTLYGSSSLGSASPLALKPAPVAFYPLGDNSASNPLTQPNEAVEDASVFDFDGSNDFIDLGTEPFVTGEFSISMWIRRSSTSVGDATQVLIGKDNISAARVFNIFFKNITGQISFWVSSTGTYSSTYRVDTSTSINDTNWHNIVFLNKGDGQLNEIYIDGTEASYTAQGEGRSTLFNTTAIKTSIGADALTGTTFNFNGQISNVVIWNSDQSSEISNIYNSGIPATSYTNTPTAWYKLDQSANWDVSGSGYWDIPDASGNGNDGISLGMTSANLVLSDLTRALPYDSYSFNFDGVNDYIDCGNTLGSGYSSISVSSWVNFDNPNVALREEIISKDDGSNRSFALFKLSNSDWAAYGTLGFLVNDGTTTSNATVSQADFTPVADTWYHVLGTWDGANIKLYINGELKKTTAFSASNLDTNTVNVLIGDSSVTGSYFINGKISNCSIFDEALTSTEVMKLYSNGMPQDLSSFTPAPVSWWTLGSNSFFNGTNYICRDLIGSNDGTSANAGVDAIVGDSPRSSANGVGTNNSIPENLVGTTKYSSNNSWSINMSSTARVEDTP